MSERKYKPGPKRVFRVTLDGKPIGETTAATFGAAHDFFKAHFAIPLGHWIKRDLGYTYKLGNGSLVEFTRHGYYEGKQK